MRIISGQKKGMRLKVRGRARPTGGKVRAAVFNILVHDLSGVRVLDLFAGTGAMGMEALSRGAELAVMVDSSRDSARAIRDNLESLGLSERARVMEKKAGPALKLLEAEGESFGLVFMDPPYGGNEAGRTLRLLSGLSLLEPEAVVVVEHHPGAGLSETYGDLSRTDLRTYGGTAVSFYERTEP